MQIKRRKPAKSQPIPQAPSLRESMTPWQDRSRNAPEYYSGISEERAFSIGDDIHNAARSGDLYGQDLYNRILKDMKLDVNNPEHAKEIDQFLNYGKYGKGKFSPYSKHRAYGVPNTSAQEGMWASILTQSGNPASQLNVGGDPHVTDVGFTGGKLKGKNIDVNNSLRPDGRVSLGVVNIPAQRGYRGDGMASDILKNADNSWTLRDVVDEFKGSVVGEGGVYGDGKLLQSGGRGVNTNPDLHMSQEGYNPYQKEYIVGSHHRPGTVRNQTAMIGRNGRPLSANPYNPKLGKTNFIFNNQALSEQLMDMNIGEMKSKGIWLPDNPQYRDTNLDLKIPRNVLEDLGEGAVTRRQLLDPKVMQKAGDLTREFTGDFNAQLVPGADEAIKGLKRNWKGGLGASVMSGASREAAKKAAQGDWAGAMHEAAMSYGTGAVIESGLKRAATTGVGKRVVGAVGKRLAAAGARFAGGSAVSGGLLAPALAVATVADVADGVTEGLTGKGIVTHAREAGERAEASKQSAIAQGASQTDLRRSFRRSQPASLSPQDIQTPASSVAQTSVLSETQRRRNARRSTRK